MIVYMDSWYKPPLQQMIVAMAKPMAMEEEINNASKSLVKPDNMFSEIISLIQLVKHRSRDQDHDIFLCLSYLGENIAFV